MSIVLIGFQNCGKTSVGQLIAKKLNQVFIDTDRLIEQYDIAHAQTELSVRDIYQQKGEDYFRAVEKKVITNLADRQHAIIATGGGSILDADNVTRLKKQGSIIYLSAPFEVLLKRIQLSSVPAFLDASQMEKTFLEHFNQRKMRYASAADREIFTENKSIHDIAEEIIFNERCT